MATSVPEPVAPPVTGRPRASATPDQARMSRSRRIALFVAFGAVVLFLWEAVKWLGGVPWRLRERPRPGHRLLPRPAVAPGVRDRPQPAPLVGHLRRAGGAGPAQPGVVAAPVPGRRGVLHVARGGTRVRRRRRCSGSLLATLFVHFGLLERAFVPYVVASQTIPIVALAPMIVFAFGPGRCTSVVVIATYLTFFPVTIAMIRGLRSPDPRALELMRSYAASKWQIYRKLRLPASMPYLFTALEDRGDRQHRRRDHRRGTRRHPERARARDHQLQPAVHHRPREAVGGDPRRRRCSASRSSCIIRAAERVRAARTGQRGGADGDDRSAGRQPVVRISGRRQGVRAREGGAITTALQGIDLDIRRGRVRVADRPVGLRQVDAAAHHRRPHRSRPPARSTVNGKPCARARLDRDYGMVFQAPVLFDWRTVEDNVKLPLELMG